MKKRLLLLLHPAMDDKILLQMLRSVVQEEMQGFA